MANNVFYERNKNEFTAIALDQSQIDMLHNGKATLDDFRKNQSLTPGSMKGDLLRMKSESGFEASQILFLRDAEDISGSKFTFGNGGIFDFNDNETYGRKESTAPLRDGEK